MTNERTESMSRARWWLLLLAIPVMLAGGAIAVRSTAIASDFGWAGHGFGASPERHKAFMQRRLDRALSSVNATDSQRTAIKAIFERMAAEMKPLHDQRQRLHDDLATALIAPTVDRAAVEKLRGQVAAQFERSSQVFANAIVDAAQVLSAEQRQALVKTLHEHHGRRDKAE